GTVLMWRWRTSRPTWGPFRTAFMPVSVSWSPDGRLAVVVGVHRHVVLYDPPTREGPGGWAHTPPPSDPRFPPQRIPFSPDGRSAVTFSFGNAAHLWDVSTRKLLRSFPHGGSCLDARFSRDGRLLVTASLDQKVRVWDVGTGRELASRALPDWVFTARF